MKVRINIDRAAAIRAGRDLHGAVVVEVDLAQLSVSERAELAAAPTANSHPDLAGWVDGSRCSTDLPSPALDGTEDPVDAVRAVLAARRAVRAHRVTLREARIEEATRTLAEALPRLTAAVEREEAGGERSSIDLQCPFEVPATSPLRRDLDALRVRRDTARRARAEAEAEAKRAGEAALRNWSQRNGSALLVARIAGDYSWTELARNEFFDANTPAGYTIPRRAGDEYAERKTRTVPDMAEIEALAEACRLHPGAELGYIVVHHDHDDCDDNCNLVDHAVVRRYVAIVITLTAPDGSTTLVECKIAGL